MTSDYAGRNVYRRAVDSGLLYAEGYACRPRRVSVPVNWAWCLDGGRPAARAGHSGLSASFGWRMRVP